ncbi:AAA family ATPase [Micromonospora chersina]|uniref:AAA family ATPase n=1 Tax=Micromonospora chersina TaxID=47854 RepID=UPI00371E0FD7
MADNWNDWYDYRTMFHLWYVDNSGQRHAIGNVKIGQQGLLPDDQSIVEPDVPSHFQSLRDDLFSLGQDDTYYEALNRFGPYVRVAVLSGLRDIAFDEAVFELAIREYVTSRSLLRDIPVRAVVNQFRRIARGGARLTPYQFTYITGEHRLELTFSVVPESRPPTNVHVLIGRNGVGKTRMMNSMAKAFLFRGQANDHYGAFAMRGQENSVFVNLVFVSFSAFDLFEPIPQEYSDPNFQYAYVGLQKPLGGIGDGYTAKSGKDLTKEFGDSLARCLIEPTRTRWIEAVKLLEADPIFRDSGASTLLDPDGSEDLFPSVEPSDYQKEIGERARHLYRRLSSGHKIVLLTITRLVETVGERSLVLMDEPEGHLHPPLLSAFVRAVSELLVDRNGVAIIATHSPVVLQEVPRSCVWKIRRSGYVSSADRPRIETFGENIGVLTREVFGLEVTQSGFHNMLREQVEQGLSYRQIIESFDGQLGDEARGIIQGLLAEREAVE